MLDSPQAAALHGCKLDLYEKACICAQDNDPNEVLEWLRALEGLDATRRHFIAPAPGFVMLDHEIVAALTPTVPGELKRTLHNWRAEGAKKNRLLGGREMLDDLFKCVAASPHHDRSYGIQGATSITCVCDDHIAAFRNYWGTWTVNMKKKVPLVVRAERLSKTLGKTRGLLPERTCFRNNHPGDITPEERATTTSQSLVRSRFRSHIEEADRAKQETPTQVSPISSRTLLPGSAQPATAAPGGQQKSGNSNALRPNSDRKGKKPDMGTGAGNNSGEWSTGWQGGNLGKEPGSRRLCADLIYGMCTQQECGPLHAHPDE